MATRGRECCGEVTRGQEACGSTQVCEGAHTCVSGGSFDVRSALAAHLPPPVDAQLPPACFFRRQEPKAGRMGSWSS